MIKLVYIENQKEKIISILKNSLLQVLLLIFILSIIYILCYLIILNKKIEKLANKDSLTSLLNRRAMRRESNKLLNIATRYNQDLSLLLLDIDFFKNVNDTYGHHIGDLVIKEVASILNKNARESDLVSRYGGEEFLIMLSNSNSKNAYTLAERIRKDIAALKIENYDLRITISIGCTEYKKEESLDNFIKRVDLLLYKAKDQGRNQTVKG
jgi:diguanylate cyclase